MSKFNVKFVKGPYALLQDMEYNRAMSTTDDGVYTAYKIDTGKLKFYVSVEGDPALSDNEKSILRQVVNTPYMFSMLESVLDDLCVDLSGDYVDNKLYIQINQLLTNIVHYPSNWELSSGLYTFKSELDAGERKIVVSCSCSGRALKKAGVPICATLFLFEHYAELRNLLESVLKDMNLPTLSDSCEGFALRLQIESVLKRAVKGWKRPFTLG